MNIGQILSVLPSLPTIINEVTSGLSAITSQDKPSELVRAVQQIINIVAPPSPPLATDGWLGPKTKEALLRALFQIGVKT